MGKHEGEMISEIVRDIAMFAEMGDAMSVKKQCDLLIASRFRDEVLRGRMMGRRAMGMVEPLAEIGGGYSMIAAVAMEKDRSKAAEVARRGRRR